MLISMNWKINLSKIRSSPACTTNNMGVIKNKVWPWLMWLSWMEHHLIQQKVGGSIPSQGTY